MRTVSLFSFSELSPEAQAHAVTHEMNARAMDHCVPWGDEIQQSYAAIIKACGAAMDRNGNGKIDDNAGSLEGARALAWLENNVIGPVRIPWTGKRRSDVRKFGKSYCPDQINPCPFTGVCFDEAFLDSLREDLTPNAFTGRSMPVTDAIRNLSAVADRLCEDEITQYLSPDSAREWLIDSEKEFFADGRQA